MKRSAMTAALCAALSLIPGAMPASDSGAAALLEAARAGSVEEVVDLVEQGVDVDSTDKYGSTALAAAAVNGHLEVVETLLEKGADPNLAETFYGARPLEMALFFAQQRAVALALLAHGAEDRDQALGFAMQGGDLELATAAIDAGPIRESTLEQLRAAGLEGEFAALLERAESRPDPAPPTYALEELHRFTGLYEGFAGDESAEAVLREGRLRLSVSGGAFEDLEVRGERAFINAAGSIRASFFGRAGTIEGIALDRDGEQPASLRRAVAEPVGVAGFVAPEEVAGSETVHWPAFRGSNRTGVGDGAEVATHWDLASGSGIRWDADLEGLGNSSPIVWGDRVYVTTAVATGIDQTLRTGLTGEGTPVSEEVEHSWKVIAFDKKTGDRVWETEIGRAIPATRRHFKATQANSTPATDGESIVVVFPTAGMAVLEMDGTVRWQLDLGGLNAGAFSDPGIEWGYASSPILVDGRVILQVDVHEGPYLAAWDARTGEELWRVDRDVAPSWSTPAIVEGSDGDELVVNGSTIHAYDPANGEELWSLGPNSELVIAAPVVSDQSVIVSAGYPPIKPIYAVPAGIRGDLAIADPVSDERLLWGHGRGGAYMPTPLLYRGVYYVIHHNGIFVTYDAGSGAALTKSRFSQRGTFTASPVAANGRLYAGTEEGLMYVLEADPEYAEVAVHDFGEPLMATPAISEGALFVRTPSRLLAIEAAGAPDGDGEPAAPGAEGGAR